MRRLFDSMAVMVYCRIASLAFGLLMIPVLLHFLRGVQFAAWAVYVTVGLAFTTLEAASSNTHIRFVAPSVRQHSPEEIGRVVTNVSAILLSVYLLMAPIVVVFAAPAARALRLPVGAFVSAATMIVLLYGAAALRALLLTGQAVLVAGGNFQWYSLAALGISLGGNVAAVTAAAFVPRADVIVAASWAVQLALLLSYFVFSVYRYRWRVRIRYVDRGVIGSMLRHGAQLQLKEWATFFNYQFDKFLIAVLCGLWGVGPFEVANRAVLALRSVPASGLGLILPAASSERNRSSVGVELYREATRYAAFTTLLFLGVPLAAGWYFMFAWAAQTGYYARWAFPALGVGVIVAVVAIPAALILQAEGRPEIEARAAGISVLINLPLSVLLIPRFGAAGASVAIGVATATGATLILRAFHRLHGFSLRATLEDLWRTAGSLTLVIAGTAVLSAISFKMWFTPVLSQIGYSADARMFPAMVAVALGSGTALLVVGVARKRAGFGRLFTFLRRTEGPSR